MTVEYNTVNRKEVTITEVSTVNRLMYVVHDKDGLFSVVDPYLMIRTVVFEDLDVAKQYAADLIKG